MPKPQPAMILIAISGNLDRLQAALSLAATAAASGRLITLYLTGPAVQLWHKEGPRQLRHSDGRDFAQLVADQAAKNLPDITMLLDALSALTVDVLICDSALTEAGLDLADLRTSPSATPSGYASLLARASDLEAETGLSPNWLTF